MASICTVAGARLSPPGILNFGWSQGCAAFGLAAIQARALAISSSRSRATSASRPMARALATGMSAPSPQICMACCSPTRRSSRCVPPPPGSRPSLTSGWPSLSPGSSRAMRAWQASAISKPPPRAWPFSAATTGLPCVSSARRIFFSAIEPSKGSSGLVQVTSRSRSAPAQKSALPLVRIMPLTAGSAILAGNSDRPCTSASASTFIGRPGRFIVATRMPSLPSSVVIAWLMLRPVR